MARGSPAGTSDSAAAAVAMHAWVRQHVHGLPA